MPSRKRHFFEMAILPTIFYRPIYQKVLRSISRKSDCRPMKIVLSKHISTFDRLLSLIRKSSKPSSWRNGMPSYLPETFENHYIGFIHVKDVHPSCLLSLYNVSVNYRIAGIKIFWSCRAIILAESLRDCRDIALKAVCKIVVVSHWDSARMHAEHFCSATSAS